MSYAYSIARKIHDDSRPIICVLEHASDCEKLLQDLIFLLKDTDKTVAYLSDYEVLPTDHLSPANAVVTRRLQLLHQIRQNRLNIIITTIETLCRQLPPLDFVAQNVFSFHKNDQIDLIHFKKQLSLCGYQHTHQVTAPLQFTVRGGIIDLYPPHSKQPIRLELDDDTLSEIHYFDQETQRSSSTAEDSVVLTPILEYTPTQVDIKDVETRYPDLDPKILSALKKQHVVTGWQRYLALFHRQLAPLTEYFNHQCHIMTPCDLKPFLHAARKANNTIDIDHVISEKTCQFVIQNQNILLEHSAPANSTLVLESKTLKDDLTAITKKQNVLFVCQSYFRLHQLESLLLSKNITFEHVTSWYAFTSKNIQVGLCLGSLAHAINLPKNLILPEQSLTRKIIIDEPSTAKPSMHQEQLSIGDFLIHEDHGVGQFIGIETRKIQDIVQDFVIVRYANDDKLLFPPDQLFKIHPYHGDETMLDELRSKRWQKRKAKALKNIEEFSAKLLRLQSSRQQSSTKPFSIPGDYSRFTQDFPFTETKDQIHIMEAITEDFKKPQLFDRLVCGDVGFGKTEIAMRSAFIALGNGYQVAIIAPTTVLATQHYNNFKERFKNCPINISLISRSNQFSKKEEEAITLGETKLIIGTHKLLNLDFDELGLVIIDEEHRFGVKQKDSILAFNLAHKLSLTATPIPRSLNMALSKLRQLSIMTSPPRQRLPIITEVMTENDAIVKTALEREIHRGGQAYIIYNDVKSIDRIHKKLDTLCPHMTFGVVHGQMPASAIEQQMAKFHSHSFQVLIASTIIESGVDVANANTMIIYRADKLGLAQLHQIRGRVGRSHHQAYAYLLTPDSELGKKANMRLDAIARAMHLGAGYELSVADLEIRGGGNLLGDEQSGHVNAIGLSYYTQLLNQATTTKHTIQTDIDLEIPAIIPTDYIADTETRYQFYHAIANTYDKATLDELAAELQDRFGKIPPEADNLIQKANLKIAAMALNIISIQSREDSVLVDVGEKPMISGEDIIALINRYPNYSFGGKHHIKIIATTKILKDCQILLHRLADLTT
ncbi:DEAD/DEAH box helicase [Candidatus Synchoanobacter obligatus]|uniref:Transcription-repair-coupling factor n=1 Tax=Candidatus Synchoanobacter obligatus TaxID=2919597 RepID=A0ABT1L634_9GAMM|nr:DEAD/DEAH box helicase [Candidatus Synchoanobacter obligatus]MCP8352607.1 DEAD/DEAH box helicase [Candidatus Synchoanobacter obligatus]